jgi:hypothetical protein
VYAVTIREPKVSREKPLRVTSLNPVRDAKTIGHDVGVSRVTLEEKNTALRHRFIRLLADGESVAIAEAERENRIAQLLNQLKWAYDGIADDILALEAAQEGPERRDQLLREALDELATMAELSTGVVFSTDAPWRLALDALRGYIERLITSPLINALTLADIDLALQRIERIEKTAMSALRSYFGYINA